MIFSPCSCGMDCALGLLGRTGGFLYLPHCNMYFVHFFRFTGNRDVFENEQFQHRQFKRILLHVRSVCVADVSLVFLGFIMLFFSFVCLQ